MKLSLQLMAVSDVIISEDINREQLQIPLLEILNKGIKEIGLKIKRELFHLQRKIQNLMALT